MLLQEIDYSLRGKCKELSEALVKADPALTLVRGYYHCPEWGQQQHWWTVTADDTVIDPTAMQFPSLGSGEYEPFDGIIQCAECGEEMYEENVGYADGRYAFCSSTCYGHFVGF